MFPSYQNAQNVSQDGYLGINIYSMKIILFKAFISFILILSACAPSDKRKEEIAIITCNIIAESRNMDAVVRLTELNKARKEIGEDLFLGTDDDIKFAFSHGICKELVLNDPMYDYLVEEILERERIRKEEEIKRQEEELARLQEEYNERQEQARIKAENERLRRQEQERIRLEEIARRRKEFNDSIIEYFIAHPLSPELLEVTSYGNFSSPGVMVSIKCGSSSGFYHELTVKTKDREESVIGVCKSSISEASKEEAVIKSGLRFTYSGENKTGQIYQTNHPILGEIESIRFRLTGKINYDYLDFNLSEEQISRLNPLTHGLNYGEEFTEEYNFELLGRETIIIDEKR